MQWVSFIGSAGFYLPLLVVMFWCVSPRVAARGAILVAFSGMLNTLLKLVFADPRPYWTDTSVRPGETESTFGMPSGHAQGSLVAFGYVAAHLRRRWMWTLAVLVIALVGVSRVHLGVHSPGQVAAGWAVGAVLLVLVLRLEPVVAPWWRGRHITAQLGLSIAVAMAFLVPSVLAVEALRDWRMPGSWRRAIIAAGGGIEPVGVHRAAIAAGILCGVLAGLSLLAHRGWFDPRGSFWRRAARVPVGGAGAAALFAAGLPLGSHPAAEFGVQAVIGLWLTLGAPETFVRLGLAARPGPAVTREADHALGGDS
jgi:PAP2 superfamily protein